MNTEQYRGTRLLFIRHGQSVANAERRVQGWGDDPLTQRGEEQVRGLARWLQSHNPVADLLLSSPLQRARQTAEPVGQGLGLSIQTHHGLKEINLGQFENLTEGDFFAALAGDDYHLHVGETDQVFARRVIDTMHELLTTHHGQSLIIVSHLGVVCTALAWWLDGDVTHAWQTYGHMRNTAMTEVVFRQRAELLRHNDAPHLG